VRDCGRACDAASNLWAWIGVQEWQKGLGEVEDVPRSIAPVIDVWSLSDVGRVPAGDDVRRKMHMMFLHTSPPQD